MYINSLEIRNFRNYSEEKINFNKDVNIIYGKNAQGKTNLIESIAYLSLGNSLRNNNDKEILKFNEDFFFIRGEIKTGEEVNTISVGFDKKNKRKIWKYNNNVCKKLSEIAGKCHIVSFVPDDLSLVKEGPSKRRLFLDKEMVQLFPGFHVYLTEYRKLLGERNELLRQSYKRNDLDILFDSYEEKMALTAAFIIKKRAELIENLKPICKKIQDQISNGKDVLEIEYLYSGKTELGNIDLINIPLADLKDKFIEIYKRKREDDKQKGITQIGPHRDDIDIKISGKSGRVYSSQGQQRTAALSLKLSEIYLVKKYKNDYPILLLDDVLSELDEKRRDGVINLMVGKAQVFITTTDANFSLENGQKIYINAGKIEKIENE